MLCYNWKLKTISKSASSSFSWFGMDKDEKVREDWKKGALKKKRVLVNLMRDDRNCKTDTVRESEGMKQKKENEGNNKWAGGSEGPIGWNGWMHFKQKKLTSRKTVGMWQ